MMGSAKAMLIRMLISSFLLECVHALIGDTLVLEACSYIPRRDEQMNAYIGSEGYPCCMCWKGVKLVKDCVSEDLPNSTICDPCEQNDEVKEYIDFQPHMQRFCEVDTVRSCDYPKVYIEGSASNKSKCECDKGYESYNLANQVLCKKLPISSISVTTSRKPSRYSTNSYEDRSTTESTAGVTIPVVKSTEYNINKGTTPFSSMTSSVTTGSNQHAGQKTGIEPIWIAIIVVGIILILILIYYLCFFRSKRSSQEENQSDPEKIPLENFIVPTKTAAATQPPACEPKSSMADSSSTTSDNDEPSEENKLLSQENDNDQGTNERSTNEPSEGDKLLPQNNDEDDSRTGLRIKDETKSLPECDDEPRSVCGRITEQPIVAKNKAGPIYTSDDKKLDGRIERVGDDNSQCTGNQVAEQHHNRGTSDAQSTSTLEQANLDQGINERTGLRIKDETKSLPECDNEPRSVCGRITEQPNVAKNKAGPIYTSDDKKPDGRIERVGDDNSQCTGNQVAEQYHNRGTSDLHGTSTLEQANLDQGINESEEKIVENIPPKNDAAPIYNEGENNPPEVQRVLNIATSDTFSNQDYVSAQENDNGQAQAAYSGSSHQAIQQATGLRQTPPGDLRLTELHKRKRRDASRAISPEISRIDCRTIGHYLIQSDNELDDIMQNSNDNHEETAWRIFRRGFQLNPNLSLYELRDFVSNRGLGYLTDMFQDKIDELEREERGDTNGGP